MSATSVLDSYEAPGSNGIGLVAWFFLKRKAPILQLWKPRKLPWRFVIQGSKMQLPYTISFRRALATQNNNYIMLNVQELWVSNLTKFRQTVWLKWMILWVLELVLDHNRFLEGPARCWNQEKGLNCAGRLISVFNFSSIFGIWFMVFDSSLHVNDFRLSFSTYSGMN